MKKIKINSNLYARAKDAADNSGYSSVDEFVTHLIEKELVRQEQNSPANEHEVNENVADKLRGLGYIE